MIEMPRPARAVLFDLDGTLVDSVGDLADSMNTVLAAEGMPIHARRRYAEEFVGEGVRVLVQRALPTCAEGEAHDEATIDRFVEGMLAEYRERWDKTTRPYDGVAELLDGLAERGLPLTILSNKVDGFTCQIAEKILSRWSFADVRGSRPDVPRKPDPTAALDIARGLGVAPSDFVYLGDTGIDMRTAASAGMYGVGVLWGFRAEAELREAGARALIAHPVELLGLLEAC